ncbi:unnamed protein product [marine sediment metagenome]|uniref:Uncharacterized protein n=1 Tax=marine sediment metagenome TaxID=412755 RepID=X1MLH2_9ZZZZ
MRRGRAQPGAFQVRAKNERLPSKEPNIAAGPMDGNIGNQVYQSVTSKPKVGCDNPDDGDELSS